MLRVVANLLFSFYSVGFLCGGQGGVEGTFVPFFGKETYSSWKVVFTKF